MIYDNAFSFETMRVTLILSWLLMTLAVQGATPVVGKDALRKMVKLPTLTFQPDWAFDPETGFTLGSRGEDVAIQITKLREGLKHDTSDAESFQKLAELYTAINDFGDAHNAWNRAAQLYRQRLSSQPQDATLLAGLGLSLEGSGKTQEAESILRNAVESSPKEWKSRLALGHLLDAEARHDIEDGPQAAVDPGAELPASDSVALARRRLSEAGDCFEQAVKLAPDEAEVYYRRGMHRCLRSLLLNQIRLAQGEKKSDVDEASSPFSREALDDLQHASRLSPRDYELIGGTALFEIYTVSARNGSVNWAEFSWSSLPDDAQRSLREAVTRLENLAGDPDRQLAAGALEVLGILQGPILGERNSSVINLRRCLALDPSRNQAWDVLAYTLAQSQRYDELATACEERLKQQDSPRNHLLLAKAYEKLQQWDDSESEILEATREAPDNFLANLALAAALLKRSQDDSVLAEADGLLVRSERLLGETPPPQRNTQQVIDLTLTRSIYFALTDEVEAAREWAQAVLKKDKNNKLAHDILTAMDY
jgi:tetratricopeptide (TPR) repeat protein